MSKGGKDVSEKMPDEVWVHWTNPKEDRSELYWDAGEFSAIHNPELKAVCVKYTRSDLHTEEVEKLKAEVLKLQNDNSWLITQAGTAEAELARVKRETVRVDVLLRYFRRFWHEPGYWRDDHEEWGYVNNFLRASLSRPTKPQEGKG